MDNPVVMSMSHVYKKFRRGEYHDSLRDLIPALARRAMKLRGNVPELEQQEFWALRDVSFEVRRGEAVAVIGHNGAGKSTLLKHLTGLLKPSQGTIEVNGRLSALIEVSAGFHHDLTGRENIYLNGVILGMSRAEIRRKFDEIVAFSGLEEFIDTPVKRYSSGMFAKLGFSVAAHMEPDILIVDEVLSVGDYVFQQKGVEKMRSVVEGGSTVIFVSHNMKAVSDLCKRALLLRNGTLVEDGPTSVVMRTYMEQAQMLKAGADTPEVRIDSVKIIGKDGDRVEFEPGETVDIEVTAVGTGGGKRVTCVVQLATRWSWELFNTSSARLGQTPGDLGPGERRTFRFRVDLNLAPETYFLAASLIRFDTGTTFHRLEPAATLLMGNQSESRGFVHMNPRLVSA